MIRAQADYFAPLFEAKGYPVRVRHMGKRGYVLVINTATDRPAAEIATMHEAERVLAGMKQRIQPRESIHGH